MSPSPICAPCRRHIESTAAASATRLSSSPAEATRSPGKAAHGRGIRRAEPCAGLAARRHQRRARPYPGRFRPRRRVALLVATYLAVPAALAASDLVATVPSRAARLIAAHAEIAILPLPIDFSDDRVDGLAPPRRQRTGAGLVPLADDRCRSRMTRCRRGGSASSARVAMALSRSIQELLNSRWRAPTRLRRHQA